MKKQNIEEIQKKKRQISMKILYPKHTAELTYRLDLEV